MARSATSNAALQLHCTTPKKLQSETRGRGADRKPTQAQVEDVRASRYRLLDEKEQAREAREIERIQRELELQRRPRPTSQTPKRNLQRKGGDAESNAPPPYDSYYSSNRATSSRRNTFANQKHDCPPSPQWTDGDGDEAEPDSGDDGAAAVRPVVAVDFQSQVLRELQKLKEAQRKDLEAIQKLQREKDEAERKAKALEATLREHALKAKHTMATARGRPPALAFGDLEDGDESAPPPASLTSPGPPKYDQTNTELADENEELDYTDSEISPASSPAKSHTKWATESSRSTQSRGASHPVIQRSESPVFFKRDQQRPRPFSARSTSSQPRSSSRADHRPRSARTSRDDDHQDDDDDIDSEHNGSRSSSRGRSVTRSRSDSRARSASREDLRRSCSFYQEKEKALLEQQEREREAQRRLERAARATPPANLLKRQEEAQRKKREQLRQLEKERDAELSPAKRVRARDVPTTTYVAKDAFAGAEEREQARKERLQKRSQELMAQAELPQRMQLAKEQEQATAKALEAAAAAASSTRMAASLAMSMAVSVKARRKLQEQLEEEEKRRRLMRAKPVPNFMHLQQQWEKALSVKKSKHMPTEPKSFFSAREGELEALRLKKEERKRKMAEQEELARQAEQQRQRELLERTKKTGAGRADGPKLTKSDELRKKKVQEAIRQQRRQQEQEKQEQERRALRLKEASRRVAAQVKHGETKRKGDYAGEFVELTAVDSIAKEKAKKQREQFREAVQRNKERLLAAVATKPSLMERFAIDLNREEHKKNALEAVVKQVFQKNFKDMKGILTEEEEELARDLVAADDAEEEATADDGASGGGGGASHRRGSGDEDEDNEDED